MKKKYFLYMLSIILSILLFFIFRSSVFGRAGGAGGGGSSGSGGGGGEGGGELVYFLINLFIILPWPGKIILIIGAGAGAYAYISVKAKKSSYSSIPNPEIAYKPKTFKSPIKLINNVKAIDLDFKMDTFYKKVRTAFYAIQEAWAKQDLSSARKFISDGIYQRFKVQFKMMQLLQQRNELSDIQLYQTEIVEYKKDKNYDILQVMIRAAMRDVFISKRLPLSINNNIEQFIEYWSFIRKRGVKSTKDIYDSPNCPNCGSILKKLGEVAKCDYCGSITNNAEYDWVLCEITQATEFVGYGNKIKKDRVKQQKVYNLLAQDPDFSIQGLEDKASNIFMQYHTALVTGKSEYIRRFSSDKVYSEIKKEISSDSTEYIVYNRLYLKDVSVYEAEVKDGFIYVHIRCKASVQRTKNDPRKDRATLIDQYQSTITVYLILKRKLNLKFILSGGLLSHECPNCGSAIEDTADSKCPYCSSIINNGDYDWILNDYLTWYEYQKLYPPKTIEAIKTAVIPKHKRRELKDYVVNNVIMIVVADGKIDPTEKQHLLRLSRKYNISKEGIKNLILLGEQNKLSLIVPENEADKEKVYKEMIAIASADNSINIDEKLLLTPFHNRMK